MVEMEVSGSIVLSICVNGYSQDTTLGRPTDCRLAAASAGNTCQNGTDLVREAVGYSGVFGRGRSKGIRCRFAPLP
jgi:hypothetical protein